MRVIARTSSWQPWEQVVEVPPGSQHELTLRFEPGVTLTGSVLQEDGAPLEDVRIFTGRPGQAGHFQTKTDAAGAFEIRALSPGLTPFIVYQKGFEQVDTEVALSLETENQLHVKLRKLDSVRGVVVDGSGDPLNRWLVAAESQVGLWTTSAWTDADGKFELTSIPFGTTDLIVTREDFWESGTRLALSSILPTSKPLRIVVPYSVHPRSSLRMKVLADGQPATKARVRLLSYTPYAHREVYPKADSSVRMDTLASGNYQVEIELEGYATLHRDVVLEPGKDMDLGTLQLETGGRIRVQLEGPLAETGARVFVLDARGRSQYGFSMQGSDGLSGQIPTGTQRLRIHPTRGAAQFANVGVLPGEETTVRFVTRHGANRTLSLVRKNGRLVRIKTICSVTDAQGRVLYYSNDLLRENREPGQTTIELSGLELGTYTIRLQDPGGQTQVFQHRVHTLDRLAQEPPPLRLNW